MNMKKALRKIITVTICIIMMSQGIYANDVDTIISTETENSISKEDICNMVKEKINISDDYELSYADLTTDCFYYQKEVWEITFESECNYLEVTADAETGEILMFNKSESESDSKVVRFTKEQCRKIALQYIADIYPDLKNQLTEIDTNSYSDNVNYDFDNKSYPFIFARKLNNEVFMSNYMVINISGITGEIIGFGIYWDDCKYIKDTKEISQEEALEIFKKTNIMKSKYVRVDDKKDDGRITLKPVYYYEMNETNFLDAVSKDFYELENLKSELYEVVYDEEEENEAIFFGGVIDDDRDEGILPEKGIISKEKVQQIISEKMKYLTDLKPDVTNINYYDSYYGVKGKYWSVEIQKSNVLVDAVIDAVSEDVINFSCFILNDSPYDESENSNTDNGDEVNVDEVNVDVLKKQAQSLIYKMFPKITDEDYIMESEKSPTGNNIYFKCTRVINDIKYDNDYIIIIYNPEKEAFTLFKTTWFHNIDLIESKKTITNEGANDIFYKEVGISKELVQLLDEEKGEVTMKDPVLLYRLNPYKFKYIDMGNGKLLDKDGKDYKHIVEDFTDIEDNKNERIINLMNQMEFIQETNENFSPDSVLTKKDAIKWTVLTIGSQCTMLPNYNRNNIDNDEVDFTDIDDAYYTYMVDAVKMNIIENTKELNKDQEVTLMDMIKFIINGMGGKRLAITTELYADREGVKISDKGYIALAKYYKMISDDTDVNVKLTKGEAIKLLYDFISNLDDSSNKTYLRL